MGGVWDCMGRLFHSVFHVSSCTGTLCIEFYTLYFCTGTSKKVSIFRPIFFSTFESGKLWAN